MFASRAPPRSGRRGAARRDGSPAYSPKPAASARAVVHHTCLARRVCSSGLRTRRHRTATQRRQPLPKRLRLLLLPRPLRRSNRAAEAVEARGADRRDSSYCASAASACPDSASRSASCSRAGRIDRTSPDACPSSPPAPPPTASGPALPHPSSPPRPPRRRGAPLDLHLRRPVKSLLSLEPGLDRAQRRQLRARRLEFARASAPHRPRVMNDHLRVRILRPCAAEL